jgi:hypothetical protein
MDSLEHADDAVDGVIFDNVGDGDDGISEEAVEISEGLRGRIVAGVRVSDGQAFVAGEARPSTGAVRIPDEFRKKASDSASVPLDDLTESGKFRFKRRSD